jgi:cold shock CspA family protein
MGRSRESFSKSDIRKKKEKKRKDKLAKKQAKRETDPKGSLDDMIAYVDEFGNITDTPQDPSQKEETSLEDIEVSIPKSDGSDRDKTLTGRVSNFNESKGFGFINIDNSRESVFFHVNNTVDEVQEGSRVEFETEKGLKGLAAINVKLLK